MSQYDYLVVGSGLFRAVFAHEAAKKGKKVKVIERRDYIAGNIYTKEVESIQIHQYGAHIFHTSYINQFAEFNHYINSPVENYQGNAVVNYTDKEPPTHELSSINILSLEHNKKRLLQRNILRYGQRMMSHIIL